MNRTTRMAMISLFAAALVGVGSPAYATGPGQHGRQPVKDLSCAEALIAFQDAQKKLDATPRFIPGGPLTGEALETAVKADPRVVEAQEKLDKATADVQDTADKRQALRDAEAEKLAAIAEDNRTGATTDSQRTIDAKAAVVAAQAALDAAELDNLGETDRDNARTDLEFITGQVRTDLADNPTADVKNPEFRKAFKERNDAQRVADKACEGKPGDPGPPGKDGEDGNDGSDGDDGSDGKDGDDGSDGKDGSDGADGKDGDDSDKDGVDDSVDKDVSSGSYGQVGASDVPSGSLNTGG